MVRPRRRPTTRLVASPAPGSRFLDLDSRRYRHVQLVVPVLENGALTVKPLRVHAGGIVWVGPWLHVAATARGFFSCRLDDIVRFPNGSPLAAGGHRDLLPVRLTHRAHADPAVEPLRFSFLSLERLAPTQPRSGPARRRVRPRLADHPARPLPPSIPPPVSRSSTSTATAVRSPSSTRGSATCREPSSPTVATT